MIGCLILGTLGAMVVAKIVRHHLGWAGCHGGGGYGGGWGRWHHHRLHHHLHHGDHGGFGNHRGGWGEDFLGPDGPDWGADREPRPFGRGSFFLGTLLDRLRATPVQERTIRAAFDEFRAETKRAGEGETKRTRQDLATALRNPSFDEVLLGELYARHDRSIEAVRKSFVGLMAKVHDALDEEQRARLAALVEKGPRFWRPGFFGGRPDLD
jgi:hypothetical protein